MDIFSRQQTDVLKGLMILLMLFGHLFNRLTNINLCDSFFYFSHEPFAYFICPSMTPVPIYIFLSGYGLYVSYCNGRRNNIKRNVKLYIHYWITMDIFVTLGAFIIGTNSYPGGIADVWNNITGWDTSYNRETWFLFPYLLLSLSSPFWFKLMDKMWPVLFITVVLFLYIVNKYWGHIFHPETCGYVSILQIFRYFSLLLPFCFGMMTAKYFKYSLFKKYTKSKTIQALLIFSLFALMFIDSYINNYRLDNFYSLIFILIFILINRPAWLDTLLLEMGKRSTSMWLIHTYFCYYLFHDFIYGFKYPLVIFAVLVGISYLSAIVIDWINGKVQVALRLK
jgi:hypothetical protein